MGREDFLFPFLTKETNRRLPRWLWRRFCQIFLKRMHAGEDSREYYNSGSSPSGHSVKRTALHARTAAFTKPRFLI